MRISPITQYFAIDTVWLEKRGEILIRVEPIDDQLEADIRKSMTEAPVLTEEQLKDRHVKNPWYEYRDQDGQQMTVLCCISDGNVEVDGEVEAGPGFLDPPGDEMTEVTLAQVLGTIMQQLAKLQQTLDLLCNSQGFVLSRAFGYPVKQPPDEMMEGLGIKINRVEKSRIVRPVGDIITP